MANTKNFTQTSRPFIYPKKKKKNFTSFHSSKSYMELKSEGLTLLQQHTTLFVALPLKRVERTPRNIIQVINRPTDTICHIEFPDKTE